MLIVHSKGFHDDISIYAQKYPDHINPSITPSYPLLVSLFSSLSTSLEITPLFS
jgi:hypothetical protein